MRQVLRQCRHYFVYAALFSLFLNVLQLTVPLYMLQVFDRVLTSRSPETLVMLSLLTLGALLVFALLDWLRTRLLSAAGIALDGLLGPAVLASLFREAAQPNGMTYRDGLRDLAGLRGFLCNGPVIALFDLPWMPLYLGIIFIFHPGLGLIATLGAVALTLLGLLNERLTREPMGQMSRTARQAAHSIDASLRNAEAIQALGMADALLQRWQRANHLVIDALVEGNRPAHALTALTKLLRLLIQVAMLAAGAWLVIDQQVTSGVMMTGTLILARALAPVEAAIASWRAFADARGAYRRLDPWLTANTQRREAAIALPAPTGRLTVEQAVFTLPGMERPILRGISYQIQAGEALGILGPSGSGKSTLARLLTGIWPTSAGSVRLDGADLSRWPRDQLGPHLGYLPQDVELFAGTVAENIARMATPDSAAVVRAAQRAHAHELILRLPRGYETDIGEAGALLSGGQRQRIALARALYGEPRLLVLDEPNASLDSAGEEALARCLEQLRTDAVTVVVISHRPALLKQMDKLLVLKDGLIDMFGPCAEVLARYARPASGAAPIPPQLIRGGRSA